MNQFKKHICSLDYCKIHQRCIFTNATADLKRDAYIIAVDETESSNRILCHQNADIFPEERNEFVDTSKVIVSLEIPRKKRKIKTKIKVDKSGQVIRCSNIYCGTDSNITRHHLIPNPYRRGVPGGNATIPLCEQCHKRVHRLKTNKQLAFFYNTRSAVMELLSQDVPFRVSRMMDAMPEYSLAVA